jgi:hypothetical protein
MLKASAAALTRPARSADPLLLALDEIWARCRRSEGRDRPEYQRLVRQSFFELRALGFKLQSPHRLSGRHLCALDAHWQHATLSQKTVVKRMFALDWFSRAIGKPGLVARDRLTDVTEDPERETDRVAPANCSAPRLEAAVLQEDATFAYLLWLQAATGASRETCLRVRGTDLLGYTWAGIETKHRDAPRYTIPQASRSVVPAVVQHIMSAHGSSKRCLGWSGHYARVRCPKLQSDLRRWKYLAKRFAISSQ